MEIREMNNMLYHIREMLVWGNVVEMIDGDSLKRYTNGHIKQKDMILSPMGESFLDRLKELKLMGDTYDEQLVKEIQNSNRLDGVVIKLGAELFQFDDYENWCDTAKRKFKKANKHSNDVICLDTQNRICGWGEHFMKARDENAFPIKCYAIR
jgi:hypothetical protein